MQLDNMLDLNEHKYIYSDGVFRPTNIVTSSSQKQTQESFGFKWKKESTFNSTASLLRMKNWLIERYQTPEHWLEKIGVENPLLLDAGCGAGMSAFEYWGNTFDRIHYFGVDISEAVDVAKKRFIQKGFTNGTFIQDNISNLPFTEATFDIIFSEGVMHHTDCTRTTFCHLSKFLKPGGLFMFYVYRKKGPVREYTDDFIRDKMQTLSSEQGWLELESLTKLGIELGKLNIEIDIPVDVNILKIPAGKISIQRLFYWHVFKAFYDPNLTLDEMNHINFDWYSPKNAHRHCIEEVREWCLENGLEIQYEKEELAGITCVAKKI